jgi:hypothetical protein
LGECHVSTLPIAGSPTPCTRQWSDSTPDNESDHFQESATASLSLAICVRVAGGAMNPESWLNSPPLEYESSPKSAPPSAPSSAPPSALTPRPSAAATHEPGCFLAGDADDASRWHLLMTKHTCRQSDCPYTYGNKTLENKRTILAQSPRTRRCVAGVRGPRRPRRCPRRWAWIHSRCHSPRGYLVPR